MTGADRNLLFGILALQLDFVRRDDLIAAMNAWMLDKSKPLGQLLLDRGAVDAATRELLDSLVKQHLSEHGDNPQDSLVSLLPFLGGAARDDLSSSPAFAWLNTVRPGRDPAPTPPRYKVLRPLAQGGLGVVSVALDEELKREVALKEIQEPLADEQASRERFLLEGEITGKLEHPGVAPVYGLGVHPDGRPFYAMRLIKGTTLQEEARAFHEKPGQDSTQRLLALRRLLRRFVSVCQTVAYAHSRGIIHRDVKPANVMLGPYGETLLVDWGLARALGQVESSVQEQPIQPGTIDELAVTRPGAVLGTPQYMSPEQAEGRPDQISPASDVYSLGATLYFLLTGRPPFPGGETVEVLEKVKSGDFPPPRSLAPQIPPSLEAVCLRAMARLPGNRYASAADLAADVERFLADEPVLARHEGFRERWGRWRRRHKTATTAGVALFVSAFVGLLAAALWTVYAWRAEAEQNRRAQEAREAAVQAAADEHDARLREEAARRESLRIALQGKRSSADACLAEARNLWYATARADRKQHALALIARAAALERQARRDLVELGVQPELARTETAAWNDLRLAMCNQAGRWLTSLGMGRSRVVALPPLPPGHFAALASSMREVPKFRRDRLGWSGWVGALAFSPDGHHVAVAYAGGKELFVLPVAGGPMRTLPLPAETPTLQLGKNFDALTFAANRIECSTRAMLMSWSWPAGKLSWRGRAAREAREVKQRIDARLEAHERRVVSAFTREKVEIARAGPFAILHEFSQTTGRQSGFAAVPPEEQGSSEHGEWLTLRAAPPAPEKVVYRSLAQILGALFDADGRRLYVAEKGHLAVLDVAQAQIALSSLFPGGSGECLELLRHPAGAATLEGISASSGLQYRLTLWNSFAPQGWMTFLPHPQPPTCFDLAGDGLLATVSGDRAVRLWRGQSPVWSAGISSDRGAGANPYPFWSFAGGGDRLFRIERRTGSSARLRRLELYSPETGRLLHAFPTEGPGRILDHSADRRFAVVAAEESDGKMTLDLWDLESGKALGRLGSYLAYRKATILKADREEVVPAFRVLFSPSGRWLLLLRHADAKMEIWRTDGVKQTGEVALPATWVRAEFDADERRVLLAGLSTNYPETRSVFAALGSLKNQPIPPFLRLVELASAKKLCDLEVDDVAERWVCDFVAFRFHNDNLLAVSEHGGPQTFFPLGVWDLTSGKRIVSASGVVMDPQWDWRGQQVQLSPDGERLAVIGYLKAGADRQTNARLWDWRKGKVLREATFAGIPTGNLAVSGDPEFLYLEARDGKYSRAKACWKWADGTDGPPAPETLWQAAIRNRWALWLGDEGLVFFDGKTGRSVPLEDTCSSYFQYRADLSPDGAVLGLEERRWVLEKDSKWQEDIHSGLWDVRTGRRLLEFPPGHGYRGFDPTGRWVSSVDLRQGELLVYEVRTGKVAHRLPLPSLRANARKYTTWTHRTNRDLEVEPITTSHAEVRLHPDGNHLALLSQGVIQLWDLGQKKVLRTLDKSGHFGWVFATAQSARSNRVASAGEEGVILLHDRRDGKLVRTLLGHSGFIASLAFSGDGGLLYSGASDGTVRVWDREGNQAWSYEDPRRNTAFTALAAHPKPAAVVAATSDGRLILLDGAGRKQLMEIPGDGFSCRALAFSADGEYFAAGNDGGQVRLWRWRDRRLLWTIDVGHAVPSLLMHPTKNIIVVGGRSIQVRARADGKELWTLPTLTGGAIGLGLDATQRELFIADAGRLSVLVLDLPGLDRQMRELGLELPGLGGAK